MSVTDTENSLAAGVDRFVEAVLQRWPAEQERPQLLTRSPGRLDCMGGMADFSGALVLQMPIDRAAWVAVGRRNDQQVHLQTIGWPTPEETSCLSWPLSWLYQSDGQFVTPQQLASRLTHAPWGRHVAGICLGLLESGAIPHFAGGITLVLHCDIPSGAGLAASAAIEVATARALTALFDAETDHRQLLQACRTAVDVCGSQQGLVDHPTCLFGEGSSLLQITPQNDEIATPVYLPREVIFAAVHCGIRLPIYGRRYEENRTASLMGHYLIQRILRHSGTVGDPTEGYLANVAPSEYVRLFRNELPVKMRGSEFLRHFGPSEDHEIPVQDDTIYKIRSRTEHHIYENDRTHRFMERLARARRTGERDALSEAGELMYASHWSYGQRCGMGSIETDLLVNLIRERGAAHGLYGAKATGGGCGGSVAVLMADNPTARAALEEACAAYAQRTGKTATILIGSSLGAAAFGHRELSVSN